MSRSESDPAGADGPFDVFVSYRSAHRDWVEVLARNLQSTGRRVFLDQWALVPGSSFPRQLHEALQAARTAVLVASPDTVESGWVRDEYDAMLARRNADPDFRFVPVAFGELPDLPFVGTIHCVDFRGATDEPGYRRAFAALVAGLEGLAPGPDPRWAGAIDLPRERDAATVTPHGAESTFLAGLFELLVHVRVPVMLLAQADRGQERLVQTIRERAATDYGAKATLHVRPPYGDEVSLARYFGRLARQCGMDEAVATGDDWEDALHARLSGGERLFMLVTGIEHGHDEGRAKLAGILRSLSEEFSSALQVVPRG